MVDAIVTSRERTWARTPSMPITIDDIKAIHDAGGLDGFAREVLAEARRLAMASMRDIPASDTVVIDGMVGDTVAAVVSRRLTPDAEAEMDRAVGRAFREAPDGQSAIPLAERYTAEVVEAMEAVCEQVITRIIENLKRDA